MKEVTEYPDAMRASLAAQFLDVSLTQFTRMRGEHPDVLRPFNFLPNGSPRWAKEDLVRFRRGRQVGGMERAG